MGVRLTERVVKAAGIGSRKYVVFDADCAGFGLCVFLSGRKTFILIYRSAGRQRRFTIGTWPAWTVTAARDEAQRLKREIDRGNDPLDTRQSTREAPLVRDLIERFIDEHLPKLEATNAKDQKSMLEKLVLPDWKNRLVAEITDRCRSPRRPGSPRAGRVPPSRGPRPGAGRRSRPRSRPRCGRTGWGGAAQDVRPRDPVADADRQPGDRVPQAPGDGARERFLSFGEIGRLADALAQDEDQRAAGIIRLCMLTGARLGEVRTATFDQFNLDLAIWTKQAAYTKQRRVHHRIPISTEAVALVRLRREAVPPGCPFLFPGDVEGRPVINLETLLAAGAHGGRHPRRPHRPPPHFRLAAGLGRRVSGNNRRAPRPHPDRHDAALRPPDPGPPSAPASTRWARC